MQQQPRQLSLRPLSPQELDESATITDEDKILAQVTWRRVGKPLPQLLDAIVEEDG